MKKIGRLKKFWNRLEALNNTGKIILVFSILLGMQMCSFAGWEGYYKMEKPITYENQFDPMRYQRSHGFFLLKTEKIYLELPANCSSLSFMGILTPVTPPIPFFWFRGWKWFDSLCNGNFTIQSKPTTSIKLKLKNQTTHEAKTYDPQVTEGSHGYTRHTFPIKSKNLDSGILIIEKDGEVIEVPFEYKYQKFWH